MAATRATSPTQGDESASRQRWSSEFQQIKATSKHTLFGTGLDNDNRDSLTDTQGRYISEGYIKPISERYTLPQYSKEMTPGRDKLESARHKFLQQKSLFGEVDKQLRTKQEQALTFSDVVHPRFGNGNVLGNLQAARTVGPTANEIKYLEKYKPSVQTLKNSFLEDTVAANKLNTSLAVKEATAAYNKNRENGWRRFQPVTYDFKQPTKFSKEQSSLVELPANIRHKFGSRICDALLCDKDLVNMSFDRQKSILSHQRSSTINKTTGLQVNLDGDYENLGQKLRYDIFPGLTTDHTISQAHKDFNNQIHIRRVKNPDTFHHKRDDLITWSEQNILRERMKKAWDEKFPPDGKQK